MDILQKLLDALAAEGGDANAVLAEVTDLSGLEADVIAAFDGINAADDLTDEQIAQLETLAAATEVIRAEETKRASAAAEQKAKRDELAAKVKPVDADATDGDGAESGDGDEGAPEAVEDASVEENTPEPVVASGKRAKVNLGDIARRQKPADREVPKGKPATQFSLTAAAGLSGYEVGAAVDVDALADMTLKRLNGMPTRAGAPAVRAGIARIEREFPDSLIASGSDEDMQTVIDAAASERNLEGGSLVAAGGWCAPSVTLYDVCELGEDTDGMVDVPEVGMARGGIRYAEGPDFAAIYAYTGYFIQTEAQSIADTEKPCFEIPCPSFTEVRADAVGLCFTAGILQNKAYPEFVARVLRGGLAAHEHKKNASTISRMVAASTTVTVPAAGGDYGATNAVLEALALQAVDYRYRYRMADGATLEAVAPRWLRDMIITDIAKRQQGNMALAQAEMDEWFRARRIAVQWVYDWQDAFSAAGVGFGGADAPTVWPDTVSVLLYAAGTFVRANDPVITIDGLYDSTLLATNKYQALFTEESLAVVRRCNQSRLIVIPVNPSGVIGPQLEAVAPTAPAP